ncbi:MAG: DUF4340 domain-containing protein [Fibrobacterota bacterium]
MKIKQTVSILIALIAVSVIIFIFENASDGSPEPSLVFDGFDDNKASAIIVEKGGDSQKIVRKEGKWVVESEGDYPADTAKVQKALRIISGLRQRDMATDDPKKAEKFETGSGGLKVTVLNNAADTAAALVIGKITPSRGNFFRVMGENRIFRTKKPVQSDFRQYKHAWRDRVIMDIEPDAVKSFSVSYKEDGKTQKAVFEEEASGWKVDDNGENYKVTAAGVFGFLGALSPLRTDTWEDEEVQDTGFDSPEVRVDLKMKDGTEKELIVGKKKDGKFLAASGDPSRLFLLNSSKIGQLKPKPSEYKAETPSETVPGVVTE